MIEFNVDQITFIELKDFRRAFDYVYKPLKAKTWWRHERKEGWYSDSYPFISSKNIPKGMIVKNGKILFTPSVKVYTLDGKSFGKDFNTLEEAKEYIKIIKADNKYIKL